ncbi:hypothetical protein BA6E_10942 [Bacteroidales bacterium 6E]|nr:hypothetical protein BA6E_10942 [Bacteroidales bacterium 6E]
MEKYVQVFSQFKKSLLEKITFPLFFICLCFVTKGMYAQNEGQFFRTYWFEMGVEHGNPSFNNRFRVNAPEAGLHHIYAYRSETRGNGMMQIFIDEDLRAIEGAELYLEIWGGHAGTANKRVTINGRSTYYLPEDGTAEGYMAHQYPTITLSTTDLVNGYNVLQFACDQGTTFWGHFIVENAQIRVRLSRDNENIKKLMLEEFTPSIKAGPLSENESILLSLDVPEEFRSKIASVEFLGNYIGYNENGSTKSKQWHGFTKHRKPVGLLGVDTIYPFYTNWDVHMLPSQKGIKAKAIIQFRHAENIIYITDVLTDLEIKQRATKHVRLYESMDIPKPFWSRAGNQKHATIQLDIEPSLIEEAHLHIVTWDGGAGSVKEYFKLNNIFFPVVAEGRHDVLYSVLPIDPSILRKGENIFQLLSDTEHHGIEVLLPGPMLIIRYKYQCD